MLMLIAPLRGRTSIFVALEDQFAQHRALITVDVSRHARHRPSTRVLPRRPLCPRRWERRRLSAEVCDAEALVLEARIPPQDELRDRGDDRHMPGQLLKAKEELAHISHGRARVD